VEETVAQALLEAAGPTGTIEVAVGIFPDHTEVDVLRSAPDPAAGSGPPSPPGQLPATPPPPRGAGAIRPAATPEGQSFAKWMAVVLQREGLTHEVAARRLGVSVKTVSRWVGGETEPRLRDLRRIHEVFGEIPLA
jgi:hypothetical protein